MSVFAQGTATQGEKRVDVGVAMNDAVSPSEISISGTQSVHSAHGGSGAVVVAVLADSNDGTEIDRRVWDSAGCCGTGRNWLGLGGGLRFETGLRFHLPNIGQGESFVYARLALPVTDDGWVDSHVALRLVGVNQDGVADFTSGRPSQLPKTLASVAWELDEDWPAGAGDRECWPLWRYSPDISPILNEILARPGWGTGSQGHTLGIVIEDGGTPDGNFVVIEDYHEVDHAGCAGAVIAPRLELYRSTRDTFLGEELLGCPTDHSVTLNVLALLPLEAYVEYGVMPDVYTRATSPVSAAGGAPLEIIVDGLSPNAQYYYRVRYRRAGAQAYVAGPEGCFRTQRETGRSFVFTVQSDPHMIAGSLGPDADRDTLYRLTLANVAADRPDFHIDLGDTFFCEDYGGRDVLDGVEAVERHVAQRLYFDAVAHSSPLLLALGNHEGEQGWRLDGTAENVAVWAAGARKLVYPLPVPGSFYTGNSDVTAFVGLREDYYAWTWGDALFVVLDPYWYTTRKPHFLPMGGPPGSGDNWDWSLGHAQYDWLAATLAASPAKYKFVFTHQLTGGVTWYGRGGIEAASHALGGCGSYEWGGEDLYGRERFAEYRPHWGVPLHDLLVQNGVTIVFHGHDHVFVRQELDGVVYQECPQPSDATYGFGHLWDGHYVNGDAVANSGHLRVTVSPAEVHVEYVRAYLPGDGLNGDVAYTYTIAALP
ncbi:MAG: metallophosphoesterase [Phycisphaerae bacterium]|jgi:hypothetical protein